MNSVFDALKSLPYANVSPEVLDFLLSLPRDDTLQKLREIALNLNGNMASRAIYAMLEIDVEWGKRTLLELNKNKKEEWEQFFAYSAYRYGDSSFIKPLCEILSSSKDPNNRVLAAGALESLGDVTAIPTLKVALKDDGVDYEGREVKVLARRALDQIDSALD